MLCQAAQALTVITVEETNHAPMLQTPAEPVAFPLSSEDLQLIADMKAKLCELMGVGLAAPQVNSAKRIIVIDISEHDIILRSNAARTYPMHVLINPHYEGVEEAGKFADFEGCFSVSTKAGKVLRYKKIRLVYQDEQGRERHRIEVGYYARVLQHEIDHINGILITDRLTPDCVQGTLEEMRVLRRRALPAEKRALYDELVRQQSLSSLRKSSSSAN